MFLKCEKIDVDVSVDQLSNLSDQVKLWARSFRKQSNDRLLTFQEFKNSTEEDGCFLVRVKDHKTLTMHGLANVVFNSSLHKYIQIFIERICMHLHVSFHLTIPKF
jgi:cytidylate kinase